MTQIVEKQKPIVLDGKFFEIVEIDNNEVKAKCVTCQNSSESSSGFVKGSLHPTSNFTSHLQKYHHKEYKDYLIYKDSPTVKNKRARQTTLNFPKTGESSKKLKVDELIMDFVVGTMSPLSIVEDKRFRNLVKGLDPKAEVFSRGTLVAKLMERKGKFEDGLKQRIKFVKEFCATTDIWSSRRRSYLGVTLHWITNDLERKSCILALKRFKGSHTFDRIASMLQEIFKSFGLSRENVIKVVTDNGSNFVKAFREFGIDLADQVTGREGIVTGGIIDIDELDSVDDEDDDDVSELVSEDMGRVLQSVTPTNILLPSHARCASHTLSLVATTDCTLTKINSQNEPQFKRIYRSAMAKCAALWNKLSNRSTKMAETLQELCGKALKKPVPTRWNSLYDSISSLLEHKEKFKQIFQTASVQKLVDEEITFLEDYIVAMRPISAALDKLQSEKDFFYGYLAPVVIQAMKKLETIIENASTRKYTTPLATAVRDGLQDRFASICNFDIISSREEILAAISLPYFKLRWIPADKRDELRQFFIQESKLFETPVEFDAQEEFHVIDDFFEFSSPTASVIENRENTAELECLRYFQNSSQELISLHNFPIIRKMFLHFNTPLPSSAPSERLFNYANMVMRPNRYNLSDPVFELLVLLKVNGDELDMMHCKDTN